MENSLTSRKLHFFNDLMKSKGDLMSALDKQLDKHFSDYEEIPYIDYVIKQLTPAFIESHLDSVSENKVYDEITEQDEKEGGTLADLFAHARFYSSFEKELKSLIPLLEEKRKEIRLEMANKEKFGSKPRISLKYPYTGFVLKSGNTPVRDVIKAMHEVLISYAVIGAETTVPNFAKIFESPTDPIPLDQRVRWLDGVPAIKNFVDQLIGAGLIEKLPDNSRWRVYANCFCKQDKSEYSSDSFRNNKMNLLNDTKDKLENIIKEIHDFAL